MDRSSIVWVVALTIGPMLVLAATSFVKISIVLGAVRNALGVGEMPSALVVTAMSMVLTLFVMGPVAQQAIQRWNETAPAPSAPGPVEPENGAQPSERSRGQLPPQQASPANGGLAPSVVALVGADHAAYLPRIDHALAPVRDFLKKHAGTKEIEMFTSLASKNGTARNDELWVLAPAFLLTELKAAFAMAMMLLLPFLLIDVLVALGIGAIGIQGISANTIALPLKLALFVAVDGWRLLVMGLLKGYA